MEKEESEVERVRRALPSTPASECCSVSAEAADRWRHEDTSCLQRRTAPLWIPKSHWSWEISLRYCRDSAETNVPVCFLPPI